MASGLFNQFKAESMKGTYDLQEAGDDVKCALLDNVHAFNPDNVGWASVSANEISGTGYSAGGQSLANQAVTQDDVDDEGVFDADDVEWTGASFTAYHAVNYDDTPTYRPTR